MEATTKQFILTKQGLEHLKKEYDNLVKVERPKISRRIKRAREFGDLAENSEYDAAKDDQVLIEARITELEKVLHKAEVIEPKKTGDFVVIGSTVIVDVDGEKDEFTIVGTMEADPAKRKISNESPVGEAMLGAKVGDTINVTASIVQAKYKILEIK